MYLYLFRPHTSPSVHVSGTPYLSLEAWIAITHVSECVFFFIGGLALCTGLSR